jgi:hypothetical protein
MSVTIELETRERRRERLPVAVDVSGAACCDVDGETGLADSSCADLAAHAHPHLSCLGGRVSGRARWAVAELARFVDED